MPALYRRRKPCRFFWNERDKLMSSDNFPGRLYKISEAFFREVPSTKDTHHFVDMLVEFFFPSGTGRSVRSGRPN